MMSFIDLALSTYLHFQEINKPIKPLTAKIEGRIINRSEVKEDKYIQNPVEDDEWIDVRVSYYTISKQCTGKLDGISASGKNLKTVSRGGSGLNNITYIATPDSIPFGTKIFIEGIGLCETVDRGSAIIYEGNTMKIDVFVPNATNKELMKLGVKYTKAKIVK